MSSKRQPERLSDRIGPFTTVPNSVVRLMPQIGSDGMALFVYLRYRTNAESEVAFPGYVTIKTDTGLTYARTARAIRALEEAGVLERQKRFGASTVYALQLPASPPPVGGMESVTVLQQVEASPPAGGGQSSIRPQTNKIESNKIDLPRETRAGRERDPLFDAIVKCCRIDLTIKGGGAKVGKVRGALLGATPPYTPEEVAAFEREWFSWAGRRFPPTVWQLLDRIAAVRTNVNGLSVAVADLVLPEAVAREYRALNGGKQ